MANNTTALKTFAQQTRIKLLSLITTKMDFVLSQDTAELRGSEAQIGKLKEEINNKGKEHVIEEVAYTWFNRVMALRFMDANGYNTPMVVTYGAGMMRPEILQDAMSGCVDEELHISDEELSLPEQKLYRKLLVAVCNHLGLSMPFLFEHISDYTELLLPDDLLSEQSFVTDIRNGMTDEDCQNVEVMGWLYQFYITDRKADAEVKKTKKGGLKSDEQAAATQLFTPHWVVRYMVENSLGRIWMTLHPESRLLDEMPYYIATPDGQTDTIPEDIHSASDIKFIDPCMGSGHVLVYAFDLFCKMYEEEGFQSREIPTLILTNNLYGIDIDHRCYQLAAFALTMKARAYHSRYLRRAVTPNVIALKAIDRDTIASTGAWGNNSSMWQFENVDTIGSLLQINPTDCEKIKIESGLFGDGQQLLKTQAEYLSQKYHCVVTNPPYLGKGFCDALKNYVNANYPNSKSDLYAAFIECLSNKVVDKGYCGLVTMESWMFLSSYEKLREYLIQNKTFLSLSHFDWHIMRIAFGTVAFVIQNAKHVNYKGVYSYLNRNEVDLVNELPYSFPNKENGRYKITNQENFSKIPGSPIGYWVSDKIIESFVGNKINSIGISDGQNITGDNDKYIRYFWEVESSKFGQKNKWVPMAKGGDFRKWSGNIIEVVDWSEKARFEYKINPVARIQKEELWYRQGITWNLVSSAGTGFRFLPNNVLFNKAAPTIVLKKDCLNYGFYALAYLNTKVVRNLLELMNPTINTNIAEVFELPLKYDNVEEVITIAKSNVSISTLDWDAHETSWDFQNNEIVSLDSEQKYIDTH